MPEPSLNQKTIHDIFFREDYFYCTKERCSMRKTLCLKYQQEAREELKEEYVKGFNKSNAAINRYKCLKCPKGKGIKQELKEKGIIK